LTERLGLNEAGIKISEDIGWNDQRVTTPGQGIMRVHASYGEILIEKRSLSGRTSVFVSSKSFSGIL